ncbi:MAG: hypothetical protein R2777_09315 [Chitinophagales bacterium]
MTLASNLVLIIFGIILLFGSYKFIGLLALVVGITGLISYGLKLYKGGIYQSKFEVAKNIIYALLIAWLLATIWMPLGVTKSLFTNFIFVVLVSGILIGSFYVVIHFYERILRFLLKIKMIFLAVVVLLIFLGVQIAKNTGQEFIRFSDEGSFSTDAHYYTSFGQHADKRSQS